MPQSRDPHSLLPLTARAIPCAGGTCGRRDARLRDHERGRTLTDGAVRLSTGTLYGIIKRLLAEGLIREARPGGDARRRRMSSPVSAPTSHGPKPALEQTLTLARRKALFRT
jgi:hypothetical protein